MLIENNSKIAKVRMCTSLDFVSSKDRSGKG